jgi:hypothetical protein
VPERSLTVDADGHVLEPRVLLVDGRPLESMRNRLAHLDGIDLDPADVLHTA